MSPRPSNPLTLEFILLGLLDQAPMHGYNLYRELSGLKGVGMVWRIKQSSMYALLEKLEDCGYLQHQMEPAQQLPQRKVFSLTGAGRTALQGWFQEPVAHPREMRQDFLARLFFARQHGDDYAMALIGKQQEACLAWRDGLKAQVARLGEEPTFARTVLTFRLQQVEGILAWLAACAVEYAR